MKLNETVKGLLVDEGYNVIDNTLGFCAGYAASKVLKMEVEWMTYGFKEPSLVTSVGLLALKVFGSMAVGGYVRKKTREIRQVFAKKEIE